MPPRKTATWASLSLCRFILLNGKIPYESSPAARGSFGKPPWWGYGRNPFSGGDDNIILGDITAIMRI